MPAIHALFPSPWDAPVGPAAPADNESERDPVSEYVRLVMQAYHYSVQNPW